MDQRDAIAWLGRVFPLIEYTDEIVEMAQAAWAKGAEDNYNGAYADGVHDCQQEQ